MDLFVIQLNKELYLTKFEYCDSCEYLNEEFCKFYKKPARYIILCEAYIDVAKEKSSVKNIKKVRVNNGTNR